ncbi:hypothetical protein PV327_011280, partial [Microctonus hyperodae]
MYCKMVLLGVAIFITITEDYTKSELHQALIIFKNRIYYVLVYAETYTVMIQNDKEVIELNWTPTEQFLANKNVPVWVAWKDKTPELIPKVNISKVFKHSKIFGFFEMYHDVQKSSAVVYSTKSKKFFGVIDTRFYITGLPLSEIGPHKRHHVNGPYIKIREPSNDSHGDLIPVDVTQTDSCGTNSDEFPDFPEAHHFMSDILYPEVLVFISNEILEENKKKNGHIATLLTNYIAYFNAIDMLFAKLAKDGIKIQINIAGFVIEA